MPSSSKLSVYLKVLLFAAYFINGIILINANSVVSDEGDHLDYGIRMLKGQPEKIRLDDGSTQPVSAFNAIPRAVIQVLHPGLKKTDGGISDAINGRYISLLICALIGLYVYRWSKALFGEKAGLFSLFLFVCCPNTQANIPIVGTDAYAALITVTAAYYFWRFTASADWRNFCLFSLCIGLGMVTKQSLLLLPAFFGLVSLVMILQKGDLIQHLKLNLLRLLVLSVIVLLVINLAFLFRGTGSPLRSYEFMSDSFNAMKEWKGINVIPLPLPVPFLEGFDRVKYMMSLGSGNADVSAHSYIMGKYFTGNAVKYYYSMVFLFKTPLSVLTLLVLLFVTAGRFAFSRAGFMRLGMPLSLALFFFAITSIFNTSQHGLRHLLMIYPLFYVCFGVLVAGVLSKYRTLRAIILVYSVATFYFYFPNLLSYTNELIWNKKNAYKILASTNIDHHQGYYYLQSYLRKHPGVRMADTVPASGRLVLGINNYLDLKQTGKYDWIRTFQPVGHVNHCYLLFDIKESDLRNKP